MLRKRKRKRKLGWIKQLFGEFVKGFGILNSRTTAGLCRRGMNSAVLPRSPNLWG